MHESGNYVLHVLFFSCFAIFNAIWGQEIRTSLYYNVTYNGKYSFMGEEDEKRNCQYTFVFLNTIPLTLKSKRLNSFFIKRWSSTSFSNKFQVGAHFLGKNDKVELFHNYV